MSTYKQIKGTAVQSIDGEPENPLKGQLWYDTVDAEFKYKEQVTGNAWSTGNSLNTARRQGAGAGTQTSALTFTGRDISGTRVANTESWDGTSWTEVNDLNTARAQIGGAGTQTSALAFGGDTPPRAFTTATEEWTGAGTVTKTFTDS